MSLQSNAAASAEVHASRLALPSTEFQITPIVRADLPALVDLHDRVFGPGRYARTAYRVREHAPALSVACRKLVRDGATVGASQMTWVQVSDVEGMLLGPLCVVPAYENRGLGQALVEACRDAAVSAGAAFVMLVGDLAYYQRCGFSRVPHGSIALPGPVDPARLLIWQAGDNSTVVKGLLAACPGDPHATPRAR
ncbi:MAG: N-acetyltransferase [Pseudomonadota bacterium]